MKRAYMSSLAGLAGIALAAGLALPAVASAQDYDGYCYQKKHDAGKSGLVAGAIIGGIIGSNVAAKHHRDSGTAVGAVLGGAIGSNAGRDSVKCYNGEYYAYNGTYYDPPPAPDGYSTVYYRSRPSSDAYSRVETRRAYNDGYARGYADRDDERNDRRGYYDSEGYWHDDPR